MLVMRREMRDMRRGRCVRWGSDDEKGREYLEVQLCEKLRDEHKYHSNRLREQCLIFPYWPITRTKTLPPFRIVPFQRTDRPPYPRLSKVKRLVNRRHSAD